IKDFKRSERFKTLNKGVYLKKTIVFSREIYYDEISNLGDYITILSLNFLIVITDSCEGKQVCCFLIYEYFVRRRKRSGK
ncbi:hypothetical protein ACWFMG_04980, partial [Bacillus subtilis]